MPHMSSSRPCMPHMSSSRPCMPQVKYTPMHAAAEAGQVGAMLLMIEAGAFIDEQVCVCVCVCMRVCVCLDDSAMHGGLDDV